MTQEQPTRAPVITAKVTPPALPSALIDRPAVRGAIRRVLADHTCVLVCAAAGSGKTTAVRDAVDDVAGLAWLTLYDTDTSPGRLVTYLEAALSAVAPAVTNLAREALAAAIPHPETVGLLVEATAGRGVTLVLDEVERIADHPAAMMIVEALVRFAPADMRIVLISRRLLRRLRPHGPGGDGTAVLTDAHLNFDDSEIEAVLADRPGVAASAAAVARATGGWVTGVLFAGWQDADLLPTWDGVDPLHEYVASQILDRLDPATRDFLVVTSVLDAVTVDRAVALGVGHPSQHLSTLRLHRIPAAWDQRQETVRYHPCIRDHLRQQLALRGSAEVDRLQRVHAQILASEGSQHEAVEVLIGLGALDQALPLAESAIEDVIDQLDFEVADRWLALLGNHGTSFGGPLTTAELMLAVAREEYGRGVRIADQLQALGARQDLARTSSRAAAMMAWSYYHACRLDDIAEVLSVAKPGPAVTAVHYLLTLVDGIDDETASSPLRSGGPLDALLVRLDYWRGHPAELVSATDTRWAQAVATPWRIAALRCMGRTADAFELYEQAIRSGWDTAGMHAVVAADLFMDLEREPEAFAAIDRGRKLARMSGSTVWDMFSRLSEAKAELRLRNRPQIAKAVLDELESMPAARMYQSTAEQLDTWYGAALLRTGEPQAGYLRLRAAVDSMSRSGRILELSTAGVYLAEAAWRCGLESESDDAAEIALAAAKRQGTKHVLLTALAEFPDVVSRRLDAQLDPDTPWHTLGRLVLRAPSAITTPRAHSVEILEFDRAGLRIDGRDVVPRITKSVELAAFLAAEGGEVDRDRALSALFDGRKDRSTRAYLRQAVHQLKVVLPDGWAPTLDIQRLRSAPDVALTSESEQFKSLVAIARGFENQARLDALDAALALPDQGSYLPRFGSEWVEERRTGLAATIGDARYQAADLAFRLGHLSQTQLLVDRLLTDDPIHEPGWRLRMRIASTLGSEESVLDSFRRCERALAEVDAEPALSTRRLLVQLRG